MNTLDRLTSEFFTRDVLTVAAEILGKKIALSQNDGTRIGFIITDVEAYRGVEDKACHASKGKTPRTEVMFQNGGVLYVYLVYGLYWMLNIVTSVEDDPQAVLIRGVENCNGPGRVARLLGIDATFKGEDLSSSSRFWIEDAPPVKEFKTGVRIGVDYAGDYWKNRPWRYYI
jgi:DNA-3-methyladenine glycosylase